MSKSMKKSLIKVLLVLVFVAVGYFYTDHFDSSSQNIKNGATTNVKQTINVDGDNLKIYFVDVGQADCILINDNNEYSLIDAGNNEEGQDVVKFIKEKGVTKLN